jgi:hypothetical protein
MTAAKFVEIVRMGSDKLRVDDIVIHTGEQAMDMSGGRRSSALQLCSRRGRNSKRSSATLN